MLDAGCLGEPLGESGASLGNLPPDGLSQEGATKEQLLALSAVLLHSTMSAEVLASQDVIDKGFHRSTLSVQDLSLQTSAMQQVRLHIPKEEQAPEKDEELFAVLRA